MTEPLPFELPILFSDLPFGYKTKGGVYCYTCLVNGKSYVGSAANLSVRGGGHTYKLVRNIHPTKHLQNAWNKYGVENFVCKILQIVPLTGDKVVDAKSLTDAEDVWIERLDACNPEKGYNTRRKASTNLGTKWSDEAKINFSRIRTGVPTGAGDAIRKGLCESPKRQAYNLVCGQKLIGIKHTEERRRKNSESHKTSALAIAALAAVHESLKGTIQSPERRAATGKAVRESPKIQARREARYASDSIKTANKDNIQISEFFCDIVNASGIYSQPPVTYSRI